MAKRHINQLFCVFDLSICKELGLIHPLSTRAIFSFDRHSNKKEIQILNSNITEEMRDRLLKWLETNIDENIVEHLKSSEIDMDRLAAANY